MWNLTTSNASKHVSNYTYLIKMIVFLQIEKIGIFIPYFSEGIFFLQFKSSIKTSQMTLKLTLNCSKWRWHKIKVTCTGRSNWQKDLYYDLSHVKNLDLKKRKLISENACRVVLTIPLLVPIHQIICIDNTLIQKSNKDTKIKSLPSFWLIDV